MRKLSILALAAVACSLCATVPANAWLMNKDVYQTFVDPQDNFEVCFKGDFRNVPLTKGVIKPAGWGVNMSYNAQTGVTCFSFFGPPINQQPAGARPIHFGLGVGQGFSQVKEDKEYWTRRTVAKATPGGSFGFVYNAATQTVTVTVSNDTSLPTQLAQVGWLITPTEPPLANLNRATMPPESFHPSGLPVGLELLPGDSATFTVPGVSPTASVNLVQTIGFAGSDPDGYGSTVTIWVSEVAQVGAGTASDSTR